MQDGLRLVITVVGHSDPGPALVPGFPLLRLLFQGLISQMTSSLLLRHAGPGRKPAYIYLYDMTGDIKFCTQRPDKIRIPVSLLSPETVMDMDGSQLQIPFFFHAV